MSKEEFHEEWSAVVRLTKPASQEDRLRRPKVELPSEKELYEVRREEILSRGKSTDEARSKFRTALVERNGYQPTWADELVDVGSICPCCECGEPSCCLSHTNVSVPTAIVKLDTSNMELSINGTWDTWGEAIHASMKVFAFVVTLPFFIVYLAARGIFLKEDS